MRLTSPELLIRPGTATDSSAIGRILAEGWKQAYSGFMPEDELGPRVDPDHRAREVETWLSNDFNTGTELLLVAELAGDAAGFLAARLGDRNDVGSVAQVTLLYVSPERQGRGIGRRLLLEAAEWLKVRAPGPVSIGAFEQNPFRSFYDAIGGVVVKQVMVRVDAFKWPVVIYLWPSPEALQDGIRA
ncbi:GNAT family N-acetyltransferase [Microvirga splendida]|uniref:GNAT family N-acetyltransferase n=1 Tax=Microvirga splendida TaxID=2795727 RepID=A0ABS0XXF4_9HYPH|nr:GNAT family N-acetyltransferase [Microvirga splendida]MBJ6124737.1 GNAT family N-acetyltransferase [Microvirga splendida]